MDNGNYKSSSPIAQLGGARRKNGHKANCTCHICENIKNKAKRGGYQDDAEKAEMKMNGGSKKKNGHKMNCSCPICKNMKHAKRGGSGDENGDGDEDEDEDDMKEDQEEEESDFQGGKRSKKSNGHKANCKCPICKNMMKKNRRGGEEDDIEKQLPKEIPASDNEYENLDDYDSAEKGELPPLGPDRVGGTRKRRRSNGHKATCKCPICKNMRKGKKTRRHRKRSHRRH